MTWIVNHLAWIWPALLLSWIAEFAFFEWAALSHNGLSLSMFTWHVSEKWPLMIWLTGVLAGGLATHFYWHWLPPGNIGQG